MDRLENPGASVLPEVPDDTADDSRSASLEELLSRLDWARCTGDDESVRPILELIMFEAILEVRDQVDKLAVPDGTHAWLWRNALKAAENGGYLIGPDPTDELGLPASVLRQDGDGRWYFPPMRTAARAKERNKRYDQKRRNPTKASESDGSLLDCTQSNSLLTPTVSNQIQPAGACARNSNILCEPDSESDKSVGIRQKRRNPTVSSESDALFPDFNEPLPPKPKKPRKTQPWDPLFDAIKEVTGADGRTSTSNHIGKVANDLYRCTPPYTPEDVRRLPAILAQQPWWRASGAVVSIQLIQKHIGLVRAAAETVSTEEDTAASALMKELNSLSMAELRRRAIKDYRESVLGIGGDKCKS